MCFLWVFGAGELTLLILSARAGKLLEHFWVCFLICVPAPLLLQSHTGKEMEGEHTPEAELCSVTAPLPTSLLLPREANAPLASLREERCWRQPQPGSPSSEMLLGRRCPAKTSSTLNKKLPSLCSQHIIPPHKCSGMPASLLLLFSIDFLSTKVIFYHEDLFLVWQRRNAGVITNLRPLISLVQCLKRILCLCPHGLQLVLRWWELFCDLQHVCHTKQWLSGYRMSMP